MHIFFERLGEDSLSVPRTSLSSYNNLVRCNSYRNPEDQMVCRVNDSENCTHAGDTTSRCNINVAFRSKVVGSTIVIVTRSLCDKSKHPNGQYRRRQPLKEPWVEPL